MAFVSCYSSLLDPRRHALTNEKERPVGSGKRSFDQQQIVCGINLDEGVIAGGDLFVAHVAAHADALLGLAALASPRGAGGDRAGRTVLTLGAVRRGLTTEW
jgi:hypothetical protein